MNSCIETYFQIRLEVIKTWRDLDPKVNGEAALHKLQELETYYTAILKGETTMAQLMAEGKL